MRRPLALLLALLPVLASAAGEEFLTLPEYRKGLTELRGHFEKRGEDPRVAESYIQAMEAAFPVNLGEKVPVTRDVFQAFLRYQAAWARKTRDSKNPKVTPQELAHEVARAQKLKDEFRAQAAAQSPRFYAAFQSAVRAARSVKRRGQEYAGISAVFFSDQVDDSYTRVDAGNEALERGDRAMAIQQAVSALSLNPANADALVLKAFAEYDGGDKAAAIADAQAALVLDPGNQQAYAILGLTADNPGKAKAALDGIAQSGLRLSDDGRAKNLPRLDDRVDGRLEPEQANPFGGAPSATPGVGRMLAMDLNVKAVETAKNDPKGSMGAIGAAMALDPQSESVKSWYATIANRAGDYPGAQAAAELDLKTDPNDALAYYNKAYALAGKGDKAGMLAALDQAAKLDPKFAGAAAKARGHDFSSDEAMELLFGSPGERYEPAAPAQRHRRGFTVMLMFGLVGGFLLAGGAGLFFRGAERPRVVKI